MVNGLVEREVTVPEGVENALDSRLVVIGNVIFVYCDDRVHIYASSTLCVVLVTHTCTSLSVNGHSNPLNSGVTLGNSNSVLRMREERL